ncbi:hypothetical protein KRP22_012677 [Phytophthora ramorum]|nr:hypothetical protein KRP22_12925 [Phytophthora ramorum]
MRLSYILLVAVATLFASVDAAVESKQVQLSQVTTANRIESEPDSRLLRAEVDGQERRLQKKYTPTFIKELMNNKQIRNNNFQSWKDLSVSDVKLAKSLSLKTGPYTGRFKWIEKIMNLNKADRLKLLEDYRAFIKPNAA